VSRDRLDHPEAREDYLNAVRHYRRIDDREGTSLSDDIINRFEVAVAEILADPEGWPRLPYWDAAPAIYKRSLERFPYLVLFYLRSGEPIIVGYAFEGREPGYGKYRIEDGRI
jgi:hypothetical protein